MFHPMGVPKYTGGWRGGGGRGTQRLLLKLDIRVVRKVGNLYIAIAGS